MRSSAALKMTHRSLEDLVASLANTGDGRLDTDVGLDADALQLPSVRMAHVVASEGDDKITGQHEIGDITIGAGSWRSDECDVRARGKQHAGMLGLALRELIDQHRDLAG